MSSTPAGTPAVTVERDGHVLLMGLNRPAKRNAFTQQMLSELSAAYGLLESDDNLWCGVLFAHGGHFTGGLDMLDVGAEPATIERLRPDIARLFSAADGAEGIQSFTERRDAVFTGR
ncbi:enoyl-CoA hydratase-related protein [Streptomyces sp. NPDC020379]|uniref:enoyl-CoA hydratase-related protein n=1 Tax=Streptomyces sp. NPDC020379 TaxID=3365071 RepID=UPI0037B7D31A